MGTIEPMTIENLFVISISMNYVHFFFFSSHTEKESYQYRDIYYPNAIGQWFVIERSSSGRMARHLRILMSHDGRLFERES